MSMPVKAKIVNPPPTDEQHSILLEARTPESLMINAFAGCGKTTTLGMVAHASKPIPSLALAFNKAIVEDFAGRFPSHFTVKTINGLGHGAWMRALGPQIKIDLQDRKIGKLVSEVARGLKAELSQEDWGDCRQLVSLAMQNGLTPNDEGHPLLLDSEDNWRDLADQLYISEDSIGMICEIARETLRRSIVQAKQGIICFDDQVYCPVVLGGKFPQFPQLMIDEAQDLTLLNHKMLELSCRPDGKLLVVGDPKQAIYAFRGALTESMGLISRLKPEWKRLPLATTFRCPKAIVARQQDHAPGFKAFSANPEGFFQTLEFDEAEVQMGKEGWNAKTLFAMAEQVPKASPQIAILCRNNGPLFKAAFKLLRGGTGVVMLGREIGKGLISLSKKLLPYDGTPAAEAATKIVEWREHECEMARANDKPEKENGIRDRAECLLAVLDGTECRTVGDMRALLEKLFDRQSAQITLSSIHKSKGLEWDVVVHLDPWRVPSKWAKAAAKAGDSSQLEQEWNLKYVAETRTKYLLIEANMGDFHQ